MVFQWNHSDVERQLMPLSAERRTGPKQCEQRGLKSFFLSLVEAGGEISCYPDQIFHATLELLPRTLHCIVVNEAFHTVRRPGRSQFCFLIHVVEQCEPS